MFNYDLSGSKIYFHRDGNNLFIIDTDNGNTIYIENYFDPSGNYRIENIVISDELTLTYNNWEIGREHAEMNRYYAESYNFDSVKNKTEQYKRILELGKSDIDKITYALSLNAETTLNVFIKPKSGYSGNVSVTTKKGSTVTSYTAVKQSDGRYKVTIPNISSHQLGDTYVITAATENGTATCSLSALSYVYAVLDDSNSDNTAKNAVSSFYKYFNSTIKYREKA